MVGQYLPQTNEKCYNVLQCPIWLFSPLFQRSKHTLSDRMCLITSIALCFAVLLGQHCPAMLEVHGLPNLDHEFTSEKTGGSHPRLFCYYRPRISCPVPFPISPPTQLLFWEEKVNFSIRCDMQNHLVTNYSLLPHFLGAWPFCVFLSI